MAKVPNPIDKHVGARVRMRRMMLGMSQEKLGDALDLTFQQVQKYEKGINRIGASRLHHISQILQVPISFFFEGLPGAAANSPDITGAFFSLPYAAELAEHYVAIEHGADRRAVVDIARAVAGRSTAMRQAAE